jgi:hypothetical protein
MEYNSAMKKKRRPYKRPSIRTEKVYERKSLACGKAAPRTPVCIANMKNS